MGDASTNLSKIKREHLLDICSRIKKKDEVDITEIVELEQFIKSMKYGLTFEQHEEPVDAMLRTHIPVFKEFKEIIGNPNNSDCNFLLEGDNLHSLKLLEKTHKGRIDVIYIDPPYNTLNDDFVYGDKMLDENDGFIHSKWLSFMKERLEIARKLLASNGAIFISIDDREQAQLKLLCDDIFGEDNFIDMFIWEKNPNPTFLNKYSRSSSEYVMAYAKSKSPDGLAYLNCGIVASDETDAPLQNKGNPKRVINVAPNEAKFLFDDCIVQAGNYGLVNVLNDVQIQNHTNINAFCIEGTFRMTNETLHERLLAGEILLFKSKKMAPRLSYKANTSISAPLKNFKSDKYGTTQTGNNELSKVLNNNQFSYPKPSSLVRKIISFIDKKDANVLDFFAGSGTTGQAVIELNQEDGGNRHFILCTNNEVSALKTLEYIQSKGYMKDIKAIGKNKTVQAKIDKFFEANPNVYQSLMIDNKFEYETYGICQSVTFPRLNTVITGIRPDGTKYSDGVKANLRYFQTDMADKKDDDLDELLYEASFCLAELEHMSTIDGVGVCIAGCDEDVEDIIKNASDKLKVVFVADDVLLDDRQKEFFDRHHVNIKQIPNYYYKEI